ncbi:hypothetical protein ABFA07_007887 [Porites harrisoni]
MEVLSELKTDEMPSLKFIVPIVSIDLGNVNIIKNLCATPTTIKPLLSYPTPDKLHILLNWIVTFCHLLQRSSLTVVLSYLQPIVHK